MSFVFLPEALPMLGYDSQLEELQSSVQRSFLLIRQLEKRVEELAQTHEDIIKVLKESRAATNNVSKNTYDDILLERLFPACDYDYALALFEPLKQPLYKDRNFSMTVGLFDNEGRPIHNSNNRIYIGSKLQVKLLLYTAAEQPKLIRETQQGEPILKGNEHTDLEGGRAIWRKISVREVSSKFEKGVIHFVVVASAPGLDNPDINFEKVRPLVIRDVAIKAKKI